SPPPETRARVRKRREECIPLALLQLNERTLTLHPAPLAGYITHRLLACSNMPALGLLVTYVATAHHLTQAATYLDDCITMSTIAEPRIPPSRRRKPLWRVPLHQVAPLYTGALQLTRFP